MKSTYYLTRWLFVRWIGVVYLLAFGSLLPQITGLYGHEGILPLQAALTSLRANGSESFLSSPSIFWLNATDPMLVGVCLTGCLLALFVIFGLFPAGCLFILWFLYLSITSVGFVFMSFQWDIFLLEVGLLAVFFAPWRFLEWRAGSPEISRLALWLLRLVLFKLMFLSGVVKILSGDETWRNLTALHFHYMTQPIPNPLSWYFDQLPMWFQRVSTALMFVVEFACPFLIFAGRWGRLMAFFGMAGLELLIMVTGNYNFFNFLSIGLCVLLLDDNILEPLLKRVLPEKCLARLRPSEEPRPAGSVSIWTQRILLGAWSSAIVVMSLFIMTRMVQSVTLQSFGRFLFPVVRAVAPLNSINSYGLFSVMTTTRPEIVIEGSADGLNWKEYKFKYKIQALDQMPPQVAPHQPRLDWQMWFAALAPNCRRTPWFMAFVQSLLKGSKAVTALLAENPFPDHPPRYIRALRYDYQFTNFEEKKVSGNWWKRSPQGFYCPAVSLN